MIRTRAQASVGMALAVAVLLPPAALQAQNSPSTAAVVHRATLEQYCVGCHNGTDHDGELSLESFADLQKGGKKGAVVLPGRSDASLLFRAIAGEVEPAMPPPDKPRPSDDEIYLNPRSRSAKLRVAERA